MNQQTSRRGKLKTVAVAAAVSVAAAAGAANAVAAVAGHFPGFAAAARVVAFDPFHPHAFRLAPAKPADKPVASLVSFTSKPKAQVVAATGAFRVSAVSVVADP